MKEHIYTILYLLGFVLILGIVVFEVVLLAMYGNTPASELPTWVAWFLFRR